MERTRTRCARKGSEKELRVSASMLADAKQRETESGGGVRSCRDESTNHPRILCHVPMSQLTSPFNRTHTARYGTARYAFATRSGPYDLDEEHKDKTRK